MLEMIPCIEKPTLRATPNKTIRHNCLFLKPSLHPPSRQQQYGKVHTIGDIHKGTYIRRDIHTKGTHKRRKHTSEGTIIGVLDVSVGS